MQRSLTDDDVLSPRISLVMFCRIRDKQPGCAGIPAEVDISGLRLYRLPVIRSADSLTFILNKTWATSFLFRAGTVMR